MAAALTTEAEKTSQPEPGHVSESVFSSEHEQGAVAGMPLFLQASFLSGNRFGFSQRNLEDEEPEEREEEHPLIQTKLVIGQPGDAYEQEADRVADMVVNVTQAGLDLNEMPGAAGSSHSAGAAGAGVMRKADQPLQMQGPLKPTQPNREIENPRLEILRESFQKMREKQELNEEINGAMARELARAYMNRPKGPLHATQYVDDRVKPGEEPSENEVCDAILGGLDIKKMARGNKSTDWGWKPSTATAPEEGTGHDALVEIVEYGADLYKTTRSRPTKSRSTKTGSTSQSSLVKIAGYGTAASVGGPAINAIATKEMTEEIKDFAVEYTAKWLARKGLVAIAQILTGSWVIYGFFECLYSTLELLTLLTKPAKKEISKSERIVADVRGWLLREQGLVEEAQKAAQEAAALEEGRKTLKFEPKIAVPDALRVGR